MRRCHRIRCRRNRPAYDEIVSPSANRFCRSRHPRLIISPALFPLRRSDSRDDDEEIAPAGSADLPDLFGRSHHSIQAASLRESSEAERSRSRRAAESYAPQVGLTQASQNRDAKKFGAIRASIGQSLCSGAHHGFAPSRMQIEQTYFR